MQPRHSKRSDTLKQGLEFALRRSLLNATGVSACSAAFPNLFERAAQAHGLDDLPLERPCPGAIATLTTAINGRTNAHAVAEASAHLAPPFHHLPH